MRRSFECTVFLRERQEATTAGSHPNSAIETLDPSSGSSSMSTRSESRREKGNKEDADVRALCSESPKVAGVGRSSAITIVGGVG